MRDVFKIIKWLLKLFFLILGGLLREIFHLPEKPKPVKFNGVVVKNKNFHVFNKSFAKDLTTAYYKLYAFNYADVPTFVALDEHYAKDCNRAYYCDEYREGQNYYLTKKQRIVTIHDIDFESFETLGDGYAKDKRNTYFKGRYFKPDQASTPVNFNLLNH
ncbi:DKNYY domain-containing protein [Dyadobacter luticola]|uniref:Uncharacterized protein n=1 Tax=Dyadobacter luticola TaxID=1979387 RepID=A0A5R9KYW8_9BACT|nr:DKNYY domain-containing protein [Dyadobacter luticola]TLV01473.1 hypothetical protein FEN17_18780 [Dyadobacter luticola]